MRVFSKMVLAALALGALTTTASAAVGISAPNPFDTNGYGTGEVLVWDFNGAGPGENTNFTFTAGHTRIGNQLNQWATPANDSTRFGVAEPGMNGSSTFAINSGFELTSLSVYLGSLDDYNTISFVGSSTYTFSGTQLATMAGAGAAASGDPTDGASNRRFFFTFGASDDITKVVFSSTKPAFEFDNIAAAFISTVPEPATWAMMILGFGFVGFMMRSNRQKAGALIA